MLAVRGFISSTTWAHYLFFCYQLFYAIFTPFMTEHNLVHFDIDLPVLLICRTLSFSDDNSRRHHFILSIDIEFEDLLDTDFCFFLRILNISLFLGIFLRK